MPSPCRCIHVQFSRTKLDICCCSGCCCYLRRYVFTFYHSLHSHSFCGRCASLVRCAMHKAATCKRQSAPTTLDCHRIWRIQLEPNALRSIVPYTASPLSQPRDVPVRLCYFNKTTQRCSRGQLISGCACIESNSSSLASVLARSTCAKHSIMMATSSFLAILLVDHQPSSPLPNGALQYSDNVVHRPTVARASSIIATRRVRHHTRLLQCFGCRTTQSSSATVDCIIRSGLSLVRVLDQSPEGLASYER
jgi:hypothetical protein